jgi:hypothetical protein
MPSQQIEKITPSIEIEENLDLQVKGWMAQKILIAGIFIFILAAALGLFGDGILSQKKLEIEGNVLAYEKFVHYEGECRLTFDLADHDTIIKIAVPVLYLDHFEIKNIVPEPITYEMAANDLIMKFNGGPPNKVTFFLSPRKIGRIETVLRANQTPFKFSHFIYP